MKMLHRLIGLLVLVVLLSVSLIVLATASSVEWWQNITSLVERNRPTGVWTGIGLLCLAVLFALTGLLKKKREYFLSFDDRGGTVSISTEAIADFIMKLADEFPSIIRMRPRVMPTRNSVDVVVDVWIKADGHIHEECELLQQRVRESMTSGLGISDVGHVEVIVREIVAEQRQD